MLWEGGTGRHCKLDVNGNLCSTWKTKAIIPEGKEKNKKGHYRHNREGPKSSCWASKKSRVFASCNEATEGLWQSALWPEESPMPFKILR